MSTNISRELNEYTKGKLNRIKKSLDKEINKRLNSLGQKTVEQLRMYTQKWYSSYVPKVYVRTYDLLNCISYKVKNQTVYIYFDVNRMRSYDTDTWNVHRGFGGIDFTRGLIDWIENDNSSGSDLNPRKNHSGIYMIKNTTDWLNEYLEEESNKIINAVVLENL